MVTTANRRKIQFASAARLVSLATAAVAIVALSPARGNAQGNAPSVAGAGAPTGVDISVRAIYDSNVSGSTSAVAEARGLTLDDRILEPLVDFNLSQPVGRQTMFLTGSAGYDFYERNHKLDRELIDASGGGAFHAAGCNMTGTLGYARRQSELQDLQTVGVAQNVVTIQSYRVNSDCERSIGFSPTAEASMSQTRNSQSLMQTVDTNVLGGSAGVLYSNPALGRLQVFGQYSSSEYPNQILSVGGTTRTDGYASYSGVISYNRPVGTRLDTTLTASYMHLKPNVPSESGFDGPTYTVNVAAHVTSRIGVTLDLNQGATPPNQIGVSYAIKRTAQISVEYLMSSRLKFGAGGFLKDNQYEGSNLNPALFVTRQRSQGVFGSAGLNVGKRLSLLMDARWQKQTANLVGFSYDDLRVSLTAASKF